MAHDQKTCPDCKLLKEGKGTRSAGFSEEELEFKVCRRQIDAWEIQSNERREWDYFHS